MVKYIPRRTVLRGIGGTVVALPTLELMQARGTRRAAAAAAVSPARFYISYFGISTGADTTRDDLLLPKTVGPGYDIRPATRAIKELGVQRDISLVTGLTIPWQKGGSIPPGGRSAGTLHYRTIACQVCGTRTGTGSKPTQPLGPSCDQLMVQTIGRDTPHPFVTYRVQQGVSGAISYTGPGRERAVPPTPSPRVAYDALFSGFKPPATADNAQASAQPSAQAEQRAKLLLQERRSVLDLVRDNMQSLLRRPFSSYDRQRLQQHFDEIRALENRIDAIDYGSQSPGGSGALPGCADPTRPADLSNEVRVSEAFNRLIAMAFACDLTRVASVLLTEWKCYMDVRRVSSKAKGGMHSHTHSGGNQPALTEGIAWAVHTLAQLTRFLRDTPDGDGKSVLDNSALVLCFEGGYGWDPNRPDRSAKGNRAHSTENMTVFIAGRAGGLKSGQHVLGKARHPAQVIITAMQAAGHPTDALGEVQGVIPELLA